MDRMATGQAPLRRNSAQIADKLRETSVRRASRRPLRPSGCAFREKYRRGWTRGTKNAPSRWRLRPTFRLTTAEATAYRRAINLGRSVLGARQTVGGFGHPVKALERQLVANCVLFFSQQPSCALTSVLWIREARKNGRTRGSGRKDSPSRERFRPPSRRTFRFRVVLLGGASSYRRPVLGADRNLRHGTCPIKGVGRRKLSLFAHATARNRKVGGPPGSAIAARLPAPASGRPIATPHSSCW